jgi:hypothetical protein
LYFGQRHAERERSQYLYLEPCRELKFSQWLARGGNANGEHELYSDRNQLGV